MRDSRFVVDELWFEDGLIIDAKDFFWTERARADVEIDAHGLRIAPGFVEMQLNGGFGVDFTTLLDAHNDPLGQVMNVGRRILAHGVTSFCPTVITTHDDTYRQLLPLLPRYKGSAENGAAHLGLHLEGPFISRNKPGAHPVQYIRDCASFEDVIATYGSLDNVAVITIAPELPGAIDTVEKLNAAGVTVSMGHSTAHIADGERGLAAGARSITHLFNAMNAFHHRDPCLVGLLAVDQVLEEKYELYYGLICDGIHTHASALRIAHAAHPKGSVLVTDAIAAMGLGPGAHMLGTVNVTVDDDHRATVTGTDTLAGSVATMDLCVRNFAKVAGDCAAIEAATLHPAQALRISTRKGTLNPGSDADFVLLQPDAIVVVATFVAGKCVWAQPDSPVQPAVV